MTAPSDTRPAAEVWIVEELGGGVAGVYASLPDVLTALPGEWAPSGQDEPGNRDAIWFRAEVDRSARFSTFRAVVQDCLHPSMAAQDGGLTTG